MTELKPADGWLVKHTQTNTWSTAPADPDHPEWHRVLRYHSSLERACNYTHLIGPVGDQPGRVEDSE